MNVGCEKIYDCPVCGVDVFLGVTEKVGGDSMLNVVLAVTWFYLLFRRL